MKSKKLSGFTLIELLMVIMIIGLLAGIAYPLYLDQVRKSRRSDAISEMLKIANLQEQYFLDNKRYTTNGNELGYPNCSGNSGLCVDSSGIRTENGFYNINLAVNVNPPQFYTITATPRAGTDQTHDVCTQLSYTTDASQNKKGAKLSKVGLGDPAEVCW